MEIVGAILNNKYKIEKQLGQGSIGITYKAENQENKELTAIKEIDLSYLTPDIQAKVLSGMQAEIDYLKGLEYSSLVKHLDSFTIDCKFYYVTEYLEGMDLAETMERMGHPFRGKEIINLFYTLSEFVEFLHSQDPPYYLCTLKTTDILVQSDGKIKIVDLGIGSEINPDRIKEGYFIPNEKHDEKRDVFILGMLLYELVTGMKPIEFCLGQYVSPKDSNEHVSKVLSDIIDHCLENRKKRYVSALRVKRDIARWFPEYTIGSSSGDKSLEEEMEEKEIDMQRSKHSCIGCSVLFLVISFALIFFGPRVVESYHHTRLENCCSNLERLSDAVNKFHEDRGAYPNSFHVLIPNYLDSMPICPVTKDSKQYMESYTFDSAADNFTISCKGHNHKEANALKDHPFYSKEKGIVKQEPPKETQTPEPEKTDEDDETDEAETDK